MNSGTLMQAVLDGLGPWLWRANWQAAVLAGLVMLALVCCGSRLAPRWRYALWLLVVVRLCLPMLPESPVSVFNLWPGRDGTALHEFARAQEAGGPTVIVQYGEVAGRTLRAPIAGPRDATPPAGGWLSENAAALLVGGWLSGVAALALIIGGLHVRFAARLRRSSRRIDDPAVGDMIADAASAMRLRRPVQVRVTTALGSPALTGVWTPVILLPEDMLELDRASLRFVLLHELAHVKRRDVLFNWLLTAVAVVHWFNPIVHLAVSRCRQERELICDQMVLDVVGRHERRAYGAALLNLFERLVGEPCPALAVGFFGRRSLISRRIQMISNTTSNGKRSALMATMLVAALGCATLTDARLAPPSETPTRPSQPAAPREATAPTQPAAQPAQPSRPTTFTYSDGRDAAADDVSIVVYDVRDLLEQAGRSAVGSERSPLLRSLLASESRYRVGQGDTLQSIAALLLGDGEVWPLIAERNGLSGSGDLKVGQLLVLPSVRDDNEGAAGSEDGRHAAVTDLATLIGRRLQSGQGDSPVRSIQVDSRGEQLIITAGAGAHRRIAELLTELRDWDQTVIDVDVQFLTDAHTIVAEGVGQLRQLAPAGTERVGAIVLTAQEIKLSGNAADEHGAAGVLASPRLLVFNGQQASISMTSSSEVSVPNAVAGGEPVRVKVDEGISVQLRAQASTDGRFITLHVNPSSVSLDLSGDRPVEQRVEANVTVTVPDGGAALIQVKCAPLALLHAKAAVDPRTGEVRPIVTREAVHGESESIYLLIKPRILAEVVPGDAAAPAEPTR